MFLDQSTRLDFRGVVMAGRESPPVTATSGPVHGTTLMKSAPRIVWPEVPGPSG
jgi:hypothetical protein